MVTPFRTVKIHIANTDEDGTVATKSLRTPAFPDYEVQFSGADARVRQDVGEHLAASDSYPSIHDGPIADCPDCSAPDGADSAETDAGEDAGDTPDDSTGAATASVVDADDGETDDTDGADDADADEDTDDDDQD